MYFKHFYILLINSHSKPLLYCTLSPFISRKMLLLLLLIVIVVVVVIVIIIIIFATIDIIIIIIIIDSLSIKSKHHSLNNCHLVQIGNNDNTMISNKCKLLLHYKFLHLRFMTFLLMDSTDQCLKCSLIDDFIHCFVQH